MSRRKAEAAKPITVEEASKAEKPEWNDTLRGILVALVKDRRTLWDARFRTTHEKTIQFFRDIAAILSNQDKRMNEWAVLEKWCWMMEIFVRSVERPSFDWRFKGAMAFHLESVMNGIQYLDSLTPEVLVDLTGRYAETEAEVFEAKHELSRKFKRGSAMFQGVMALYHKSSLPNICAAIVRPKAAAKRNRGRRNTFSFLLDVDKERISDVSNTENGMNNEINPVEKGLDIDVTPRNFQIKKEILESHSIVEEKPVTVPVANSKLPVDNSGKSSGDELPKETPQFASSDVVWSTEMICLLIQCVKEVPALWHPNHPNYRNSFKRKEYLSEIAAKLRTLPEDHVSGKWSILRECFNKQMKKSRQGTTSNWEHYNRLLFLSPEVISACRFDDLNGDNSSTVVSTSSADVAVDVQSQIHKILGFVPETAKMKDSDLTIIKKPKIAQEPTSVNVSVHKDVVPNVQQVVSTWVPPREDSLDTVLHSLSATPPIATAQVTAKSELAHILQRPSPHLNINGAKISYNDFVPDQAIRSHEDKWTLMGRMIEETARELEAKRSELAFRLQKDINDVIFKYQLESLRHK
ncbi:hypothetical protein DICVIV_01024 [Dictyocaulus viviparus]|uniref:MADF domain-containing protein n=1 Tax=Dictyocaulus viviparus TaxID=29172 RepID=A0A0D8Y9E7_DICVI|nr:hypothetical protein DICVIV_01024 [Dictyocaulus viviparus]